MSFFLLIIGLIVMAEAHSTMPGIAIGGGFVVLGALVYMVRKGEEF